MSSLENPPFLLNRREACQRLRFVPRELMNDVDSRNVRNRPPRRSESIFEIFVSKDDEEERLVEWSDQYKIYIWQEWAILAFTPRGYLGMNYLRYKPSLFAALIKKKREEGHYICPFCESSKTFGNYISLSSHMAAKHDVRSNDYVCVCGFYTQFTRTLDSHKCKSRSFKKAYKLRSENFSFTEKEDERWMRVLHRRLSGEFEFLEGMSLNKEGEILREKIRRKEKLSSKDRSRLRSLRMARYREGVVTQGPSETINDLVDQFKGEITKRGITGIALEIGDKVGLAIMAWEACRTWTGLLATVTHFCCKILKMREAIAKKIAAMAWRLSRLAAIPIEGEIFTQGPDDKQTVTEFTMEILTSLVEAITTYCGLAISLPQRFLYSLHNGVVSARDAIAVKEIVTTHVPELIESLHCWIKGVPTRADQCKQVVKDIYDNYLVLEKPKIGERDLAWASRVYDANALCDLYEQLLPEINARATWYLKLSVRNLEYKIKSLRSMKNYADSLTLGAQGRVEPVGVIFFGHGGLLKSVLMKKLAHQFVADKRGYGSGDTIDPKELDFYIWSRPKGSERMDGVQTLHEVFMYDDVATVQDDKERGKELCELIPICTSLPYCANVADVESKGNKFIRPELILVSMNVSINKTTKLGLTDNLAFMRRFIIVNVETHPGYDLARTKARARATTVQKFADFDTIVRYRLQSVMGEDMDKTVTAQELYTLIARENEKRVNRHAQEASYTVEAAHQGSVLKPRTQGRSAEAMYAQCGRNFDLELAALEKSFPGTSDHYRKAIEKLCESDSTLIRDGEIFSWDMPIPFASNTIPVYGLGPYKVKTSSGIMGTPSTVGRIQFTYTYKGKLVLPSFGWNVITKDLYLGGTMSSLTAGDPCKWPEMKRRMDAVTALMDDLDEDSDFGPAPPPSGPPGVPPRNPPPGTRGCCHRAIMRRCGIPCCHTSYWTIYGSSVSWKACFSTGFFIVSLILGNFYVAFTSLLFMPVVNGASMLLEWFLGYLIAWTFAVRSNRMRDYIHYATAIFGTIVAGYGTYWIAKKIMQRRRDEDSEPQSIRAKQTVEVPQKVNGVGSVDFQGPDMVSDVMLDQQMDAVFEKNQFIAMNELGVKIHVLGFARDLFLTTSHEWSTICSSEKITLIRNSFREEVLMTKVTKKTIVPKDGMVPEAVILKIQGMQVKDIVSKFRFSTDYGSNYYQCYVSRVSYNDKFLSKTHIPIDTVVFDKETKLSMNDRHKGEIVTRGFLVGNGNTVDGDCTCPWFVVDPRCPRKIAGIHIAGNTKRKHAYCSVIFQEWLLAALNYFGYTQPDDSFLTDTPVTQGFPNTMPLGEVKVKFAGSILPPKTKLRKSGLYFNGKFNPCLDLLWKDEHGNSVFQKEYYASEIKRYCDKFARIPKCPKNFEEIIRVISPELTDVASKMRSPMSSLDEVLNGDITYGTSEINLKGAKGFPEDRLFPGRGKSPIIFKDRTDMRIKCSDSYAPILEQSLKHIFEEDGGCMNFARVSFKDELGVKQRLFFAGNVPHYVAGDMVLGRFFAVCRNLRWFGPGTALNTKESHFVVMYLLSNDCDQERVIMLDISGMDLSESYDSLSAVHELIIYSIFLIHDDPDWEKKCRAWCRASLQQVWIFIRLAFLIRGRMASGQRFTAELNTILLHCMLLYCFIVGWMAHNEGTKEDAYDAWKQDIRDIEYGDDSLITVRKGCHEWFTPEYIVKFMATNFGMVFTSAVKESAVGFCTFEQSQFLRRNFIVVEGYWHAVLPLENILGTLEWYNISTGTKVDAVRAKINSALDELGLYPEDVYNAKKREIAQQCFRNGYPVVDIPYDVMRQRYLTG